MKKLLTILLVLVASGAQAGSLSKILAIDGDQVLVALGPTLTVQNTSIDDGTMVQISLDYDTRKMRAEVDGLKAQYPDKKLVYAHPEPNEQSFHLSVPTLGLVTDLRMMPGQYGAYLTYQGFHSDRSKVKAYLASIESKGATGTIDITGEVKMTFSYDRTVNEIVLSGQECRKVAASGLLGPSLEAIMRYKTPRNNVHGDSIDSLRTNMLKNCLSLNQSVSTSSMSELLAQPVRAESPKELIGSYVSPQTSEFTSQIFYGL